MIGSTSSLRPKTALPIVPSQGSVGASGDLAPLAHLALPVIGEGFVRTAGGRLGDKVPAAIALAELGLPYEFDPSESSIG